MEQLLTRLGQEIPAHFLLLTDVTGQIVSARGGQGQTDLVALGSLVAGDLAASQEIARLTGQYDTCQIILRQGQAMHTFIAEAGEYLALLIQVSADTPLGWARLLIQEAARRLANIAAAPAETARLEPVFAVDQNSLPDLFSEALDEIWKE
jgi:predicted regulator of Ras-like GTPase activity (Roadblock/LC7/MglB family)